MKRQGIKFIASSW